MPLYIGSRSPGFTSREEP